MLAPGDISVQADPSFGLLPLAVFAAPAPLYKNAGDEIASGTGSLEGSGSMERPPMRSERW
jgi:hypothetical protein